MHGLRYFDIFFFHPLFQICPAALQLLSTLYAQWSMEVLGALTVVKTEAFGNQAQVAALRKRFRLEQDPERVAAASQDWEESKGLLQKMASGDAPRAPAIHHDRA